MKKFLLLFLIILSIFSLLSYSLIVHVKYTQKYTYFRPLGITACNGYIYVTVENGVLVLTPNLTIVKFILDPGASLPFGFDGKVFVTNYLSNVITVIENNGSIYNISLGYNFGQSSSIYLPRDYYAYGLAYNPTSNLLYIPDTVFGEVITYNLSSGKIVNKSLGFSYPSDAIYYNGTVYVLDEGSYPFHIKTIENGNIQVISVDTAPSIGIIVNNYLYFTSYIFASVEIYNLNNGGQKIIFTGYQPYWLTYDPQNGNVYISEFGANKILVLNGENVIGNYTIYSQPAGLVYYNGLLYVALYGSDQIVALNPNTMQVVYSITLGVSYTDIITIGNNVYITEYYNDRIVELNSDGNIVKELNLTSSPLSITYGDGYIYLSCPNSNKILILDKNLNVIGVINNFKDPTWLTYYDGKLYITSYSQNLLYVYSVYTSQITTISVGHGPYFVTIINGTVAVVDRLSNEVQFLGKANVTLPFSPIGVASYDSYYFIITIDGIYIYNNQFNLVNTIYTQYLNIQGLLFSEGVIYNNSLYLTDGNYVYVFQGDELVKGYDLNVTVEGISVVNGEIYVTSPLSSKLFILTKPPTYTLKIIEEGLPNGTSWGIKINGKVITTNNSVIVLNLTQGIYNLSLLHVNFFDSNFTSEVINLTTNMTIYVKFSPVLFTLKIEEIGLPKGETWGIILNGKNITSNMSTITLSLPSGIYNLTVLEIPHFYANITTTMLNLTSNMSIIIEYKPILYIVEFKEEGLPNNTIWSVKIGNLTKVSYNQTIIFQLPYGKYYYKVLVPSGFNVTNSSGYITVEKNMIITIKVSEIITTQANSTTTTTTKTTTTVTSTTKTTTSSLTSSNETTKKQQHIELYRYIGAFLILLIGGIVAILIIRKS